MYFYFNVIFHCKNSTNQEKTLESFEDQINQLNDMGINSSLERDTIDINNIDSQNLFQNLFSKYKKANSHKSCSYCSFYCLLFYCCNSWFCRFSFSKLYFN